MDAILVVLLLRKLLSLNFVTRNTPNDELVGLAGFEPTTSCPPDKRANQAAPQPDGGSPYRPMREREETITETKQSLANRDTQ
jgi:hypothetical protein